MSTGEAMPGDSNDGARQATPHHQQSSSVEHKRPPLGEFDRCHQSSEATTADPPHPPQREPRSLTRCFEDAPPSDLAAKILRELFYDGPNANSSDSDECLAPIKAAQKEQQKSIDTERTAEEAENMRPMLALGEVATRAKDAPNEATSPAKAAQLKQQLLPQFPMPCQNTIATRRISSKPALIRRNTHCNEKPKTETANPELRRRKSTSSRNKIDLSVNIAASDKDKDKDRETKPTARQPPNTPQPSTFTTPHLISVVDNLPKTAPVKQRPAADDINSSYIDKKTADRAAKEAFHITPLGYDNRLQSGCRTPLPHGKLHFAGDPAVDDATALNRIKEVLAPSEFDSDHDDANQTPRNAKTERQRRRAEATVVNGGGNTTTAPAQAVTAFFDGDRDRDTALIDAIRLAANRKCTEWLSKQSSTEKGMAYKSERYRVVESEYHSQQNIRLLATINSNNVGSGGSSATPPRDLRDKQPQTSTRNNDRTTHKQQQQQQQTRIPLKPNRKTNDSKISMIVPNSKAPPLPQDRHCNSDGSESPDDLHVDPLVAIVTARTAAHRQRQQQPSLQHVAAAKAATAAPAKRRPIRHLSRSFREQRPSNGIASHHAHFVAQSSTLQTLSSYTNKVTRSSSFRSSWKL